MARRLINANVFITLYLLFLAWYDGWCMSPLTAAYQEIAKDRAGGIAYAEVTPTTATLNLATPRLLILILLLVLGLLVDYLLRRKPA